VSGDVPAGGAGAAGGGRHDGAGSSSAVGPALAGAYARENAQSTSVIDEADPGAERRLHDELRNRDVTESGPTTRPARSALSTTRGRRLSVGYAAEPASHAIGGRCTSEWGRACFSMLSLQIAAKGGYTFNTSSVPGAASEGRTGGSRTTVATDDLASKAVALRAATRMSFDSRGVEGRSDSVRRIRTVNRRLPRRVAGAALPSTRHATQSRPTRARVADARVRCSIERWRVCRCTRTRRRSCRRGRLAGSPGSAGAGRSPSFSLDPLAWVQTRRPQAAVGAMNFLRQQVEASRRR